MQLILGKIIKTNTKFLFLYFTKYFQENNIGIYELCTIYFRLCNSQVTIYAIP